MYIILFTSVCVRVCNKYLVQWIWYRCPFLHLQVCVLKRALLLLQILCSSLSGHGNKGQRSVHELPAKLKTELLTLSLSLYLLTVV